MPAVRGSLLLKCLFGCAQIQGETSGQDAKSDPCPGEQGGVQS